MDKHKIVLSILSSIGAIALLSTLFVFLDINFSTIAEELFKFPLSLFFAVCLATFSIMYCSQERWYLLQAHYHPSSAFDRKSTLMYTSIGASLAQLIPPHISTSLARSVGSWIEKKSKPTHSVAFTILEQSLDLLISVIVLLSCLLFLLGYCNFIFWVIGSCVSLAIISAPLSIASRKEFQIGETISNIQWINRILPKRILKMLFKISIPPHDILMKLYFYSTVRFIMVVIRSLIIAYMSLNAYHWWEVGATIPIMQLSSILPITPGSLGITEWAWSSVISVLGIPIKAAAEFAILHRIITLVAQLITTAISIVYFFIRKVMCRA